MARYENGKLHYVVADHLGTPRELLNEQGKVVWANRLSTWGRAELWRQAANDEDNVTYNLRFAGQYADAESGLHYNRFRYYDGETGQYLCPDPIGLLGGNNPYGYVHNPNSFIDPLGLATCPPGETTPTSKLNPFDNANFADQQKLTSHFEKHGGEFRAKSEAEYLQIGRDIMNNGQKVEYAYKGEMRTGYVMYMGNTSKGATKVGFVGTNSTGNVTTIHTKSGKDIWKTLNGNAQDKVINAIPRDVNGM